jgi:hypothetical protein
MTAAGIALIAGGLATLIGFRRALWAGGGQRRPREPRAIEAPRRRELPAGRPAAPALPAARQNRAELPAPDVGSVEEARAVEADADMPAPRSFRRGRRRARSGVLSGTASAVVVVEAGVPDDRGMPDDDESVDRFGLASIGLADDEDGLAEEESTPADHEGSLVHDEDGPVDGDRLVDEDGLVHGGSLADEHIAGTEDDIAGTEDDIAFAEDDVVVIDGDIASADDEDEPADERVRPADGEGAEITGRDIDDYRSVDEDDAAFSAEAGVEADAGPEPCAARIEDDRGEPDPAEPAHRRMARAVLARSLDVHPEVAAAAVDAADVFGGPAGDSRHADRVEGWVRPRYDRDIRSGDYWTPIPESDYAELDSSGYGWPVPVERLRAVPRDDERAAHTERAEDAEPTAVVPQWPPAKPSARIELPRTWSRTDAPSRRRLRDDDLINDRSEPIDSWVQADRDGRDGWQRASAAKDRGDRQHPPDPEDRADRQARRSTALRRRGGAAATEFIPVVGDSTQVMPPVTADGEPRRRPRPRPNPEAEARSTVYVSRHAAEPS